MTICRVFLGVFLLTFACSVNAGEWKFGVGVSYVTGIDDVADLYEDNLEASPGIADVDVVLIPVGASFRSRYQGDSGIAMDIGVGPLFLILGDADHTELPVSATVGYFFAPKANASFYARLGVVAHFADGDYAESSDPGLLGAIGFESGRNEGVNWGLELSVDDSTVEFVDLTQAGNRELNSYDAQLSLYFMF